MRPEGKTAVIAGAGQRPGQGVDKAAPPLAA